jgi:ABC-type multidrug transport system fused ATPase/permease subunit
MLSKQIKQSYIKTIVFVGLITFLILTLYIMGALFVNIDIIFLLLIFIFILMGLTAFFSITFIKLSASYLNQKVTVDQKKVKEIDDDIINRLSFGKDVNQFDHHRFEQDEKFTLVAYNFKYARMRDDKNTEYLISTDAIEVIRD